jgi:alpha-amylase
MARILKEDAERLLSDVPQEQAFWCCDDRMLRNMKELSEALTGMADETFAYHSNSEKSDFGNWVNDVIGDAKLARDLVKSSSRAQAARKVAERVDFLSAKLA